MGVTAIHLQGIGKRFLRGAAPGGRTLKEALYGRMRNTILAESGHWVLRDLDVMIEAGEVVGLIGPNGAGKSTLLKLIAGILRPSTGHLVVNGRSAMLLQEGSGFHPELTASENIFLRCALLGLDRRGAIERFEDIVAFAEAGSILDQPVKHLSTGMRMRLAWSVSVHLAPEIYLADEILSVVDAAFGNRCIEQIRRDNRERGCTALIVSHAPQVIEALCTRVLWLDAGQLVADSRDVAGTLARYQASA